MVRVGFRVKEWTKPYINFGEGASNPPKPYTNEEVLEYWHQVRLKEESGDLKFPDVEAFHIHTCCLDLQSMIFRRIIKRWGTYSVSKIGFEVGDWVNKPFNEFTNEELLEYWHKLRLTVESGEIDMQNPDADYVSTQLYVVNLQQELLRRMGNS